MKEDPKTTERQPYTIEYAQASLKAVEPEKLLPTFKGLSDIVCEEHPGANDGVDLYGYYRDQIQLHKATMEVCGERLSAMGDEVTLSTWFIKNCISIARHGLEVYIDFGKRLGLAIEE